MEDVDRLDTTLGAAKVCLIQKELLQLKRKQKSKQQGGLRLNKQAREQKEQGKGVLQVSQPNQLQVREQGEEFVLLNQPNQLQVRGEGKGFVLLNQPMLNQVYQGRS